MKLIIALLLLAIAAAGARAYALVDRAATRTPDILAAARAQAAEVDMDSLPAEWLSALVAVEDPGFHAHSGMDFTSPGAGATTITQALVKRLYFDRFQPGLAKIEQTLIAVFVLDPRVSKDEQLRMFLALAYLGTVDGEDVIGFPKAADVYFGRALADLSRQEFLSLVAMLPGPNRLDPSRNSVANAERVGRIERLLAGECAPNGHGDVRLEGCAP